MTIRYRNPVTLYLPPAVSERLRERAESESRTVSKMGELLLTQALESRGAGSSGGGSSRGSERRPAKTERAGSSPARPPSPKPRTGICEHRIPPDAFCARCDPA